MSLESEQVEQIQVLETPEVQEISSSVASINESTVTAVDETNPTEISEQESSVTPKPLPSLKDLPSLVSKDAFPRSNINWGPNMKPIPFSSVSSSANSSSASISSAKRMKSKTIQESFTLDLESQISISKPELSKIVLALKQNLNVSIESTLSKNSRTFLISGHPTNVRAAKRELVKKLTRPIQTIMEVPSKCKAAIIGSGGKTIMEISKEYDVKIKVAKDYNEGSFDEDLDDYTSNVTLFGDFESVNQAKERISEIVREETKNATIRINVSDPLLIPFIKVTDINGIPESLKLQFFPSSSEIVVSGLREQAQDSKVIIQNYIDRLSLELTEQKVKIPKKFQFLINANEIKEKYNVIVTFPTDTKDEFVSFSGEENKVKDAIDYARNSSKTFIVDTLDISKAHSRNIEHARALVLYFTKYSVLEKIQKENPAVTITLPTPEELIDDDTVNIKISAKSDVSDDIKVVRKELISLVNSITPEETLVINDLDYELFHKSIKHTLLSTENDYPFIQLGDYYPGNDTVVIIAASSYEDFKPSAEEIKSNLEHISASLDPLRATFEKMTTKVFEVDSSTQSTFFSKDAVTLSLILDHVGKDQGHVQFKLNTPSEHELTIRGDESAIKTVAKIVKSIVANPSTKSKLSFEIPSNAVSRLIGNKGSNLQAIRAKFDCQIDVGEQTDDKAPIEVTLTGLEFNLSCAKEFILAEAKKWADIITKELIVPLKLHRNLIGPNGSYRTRLQDKYSVFIHFPRDNEVVTIRGPSRGVKKAHEELSSLLDFERENSNKIVIKVPSEHVPRVIGKNGDVINDIRAEFGVEMDFLQKSTNDEVKESGEVDLEITGTRTAIKEAAKKVEQIIKDASDYTKETIEVDHAYHRNIVGTGGHVLRDIISKAGGDDIKNKNIDIPNSDQESNTIIVQGPKSFVSSVIKQINKIVEDAKNSETKEIEVPKERQGALIGPGGMIRRQLENDFNITLHVPNKGEAGPVTLTGLPENIEKAEKKIFSDILKEDFDLEVEVPASIHEFVSERGAFIQKLRMDEFVTVKHGSAAKRANKLNRHALTIPTDKVRPAEGENVKTKITILEVGTPAVSEEGTIPWKLTYEPIDISGILDDENEEQKPEENTDDNEKKQAALEKASDLIQERIQLAYKATYAGFVWAADTRKFNKVVGPGGSNVKSIRSSTGVLINVPRKSDSVNDVIYIRGTKDGVEKATELVVKSLKN